MFRRSHEGGNSNPEVDSGTFPWLGSFGARRREKGHWNGKPVDGRRKVPSGRDAYRANPLGGRYVSEPSLTALTKRAAWRVPETGDGPGRLSLLSITVIYERAVAQTQIDGD